MNLLDQILQSQYKVIVFTGSANGSTLNEGFAIADFVGKEVIIKRIKLDAYAPDDVIDIDLFDGATHTTETIPAQARINRLFDMFSISTRITFMINGTPIPIFSNQAIPGYPMDLDIDNIMYLFPNKVKTFDVRVLGEILTDIDAGTTDNPLIKVTVELYIKPEISDCDG